MAADRALIARCLELHTQLLETEEIYLHRIKRLLSKIQKLEA